MVVVGHNENADHVFVADVDHIVISADQLAEVVG